MRRCLVIVLLFVMALAMVSAMTVTVFAGESSVIYEDEKVVITMNSDGDFEIEPKDIFACLELDDNISTLDIDFSSYKSTIEGHAGGDLSGKQVILKQSRDKKLKTDEELAHIHFTDDLITGVGEVFASDCKKLQTVKFGNHIKTIARSAFAGCEHLQGTSGTTLDLSYIEMIDDSAFNGDVELQNIQFGENLKTIGKSAFSEGTAIKDLTFPAGLAVIGDGAFSGCSGLQSVKFQGNDRLSYIGDSAFKDCTSLTAVNVSGFNINRLPKGADAIACGTGMFKGCTSLQTLTWPRNFAQIPEGTFSGCTALTRLVFEGGDTGSVCESIGNNAFYDCRSLYSIDLPNAVTAIGDSAFENCEKLQKVVVPDQLAKVGEGAFSGCTAMETINADENNPTFSSSNGILFSKDQSVLVCYPAGKKDESYIFPESVNRIGEQAFSGSLYLTSAYYSGTKEQWNNIPKGDKWSYHAKLGNNPAVKQITFKVANGRWNDGTIDDKVITVVGDNANGLIGQVIPAVGSKPNTNYKAGSWDTEPSTETAITKDTTYTYTYAKKDTISAKVTFKVVNGSWNDGKAEDRTVTLTGYEGDTLKLKASDIPEAGNKPDDTYKPGSWDTEPSTETAITKDTTYTYTYAKKDTISAKVTFKVVNGSWNDGKAEDRTVTLTGYEGDTLKLKASDIPEVGNKPDDTYKPGSWDTEPSTETAITKDTTYTYTYVKKDTISAKVTFKVVNGSWNDGSKDDKTVTLEGHEGDILKLQSSDIPEAGNNPDSNYRAGGWDTAPDTETAFSEDTTYTYSYIKKEPEPAPEEKKSSAPLLVKMTAKGKKNLKLSWTGVQGAEGYDIFFSRCNHGKRHMTVKQIHTVKAGAPLTWVQKGLRKHTAYKARVKAYVVKNGKKQYIKTSPAVHAYTSGYKGKYTNPKSVKVNRKVLSLTPGKTVRIKAKVIKLKKGKRLMPAEHAVKLRYLTTNTDVATVSRSGKITAKGKGSCRIYAITVNGLRKTIQVTVK